MLNQNSNQKLIRLLGPDVARPRENEVGKNDDATETAENEIGETENENCFQ